MLYFIVMSNDIQNKCFLICRPLFASSLLGIIRTLLEQTRADEVRILGCNTLVDFIIFQVYGHSVFLI